MNKVIVPAVLSLLLVRTLLCQPLGLGNILGEKTDTFLSKELDPLDHTMDHTIDLSRFNGSLYGSPDEKIGLLLERWSPDNLMNPEELGSYTEGDILIPSGPGRNGLVAQSSRWPGGIVPFVIQGSFNANQMDTIERGIKEYHAKTCIRFKPRTNERDYVAFVNGASGCWSSVGRVGGRQEINLQTPACLNKGGTVMHEMMHAIGFFHEQNRHDRDGFVSVQFENIVPGTTSNFDKTTSSKAHAFGVPYDYGSVMHYSAYAFSRNGNPTIIPKQSNGKNQMGQRTGFSRNDIDKINRMYGCNRGTSSEGSTGIESIEKPTVSPQPTNPTSRPETVKPSRPGNPIFGIIGNIINGITSIFTEEGSEEEFELRELPALILPHTPST